MYIQARNQPKEETMNTYQIINKRNGKVLSTVQAESRIQAIASQANPDKVTAVLI
jgi:hypothetical protein